MKGRRDGGKEGGKVSALGCASPHPAWGLAWSEADNERGPSARTRSPPAWAAGEHAGERRSLGS